MAQSSAKEKYVAASLATKQAIWLKRIMKDVGEKQNKSVVIHYDNKYSIAMAKTQFITAASSIFPLNIILFENQLKKDKCNLCFASLKSKWLTSSQRHYQEENFCN